MSKGNIAREMNDMVGGRAATTSDIHVLYSIGNSNEIVQGVTAITATGALSALCESKAVRFAVNAMVQSVGAAATLTCIWVNTSSTASAPSFVAVNSIAY